MQKITINNQYRLARLVVGRASVLTFEIHDVGEDYESVRVHFSRRDTAEFVPVSASPTPGGVWRVYANGLHFPDPGRLTYHVTAIDSRGAHHWLGEGSVDVRQSVAHVNGEAEPLIPEDTYVRNPATGLWHKLTVTYEDGEIVSQVEQEGITK